MKFLPFLLVFVIFTGCDLNQDVPVNNISVSIEDILFIGQQAYINTEFVPSNTTERNLQYSSSDEDILTINSSGTITPKNKGTAIISVISQNGVEVQKTVSVYQIVTKPTIINESEEWGPYEKISGSGWSSGSTEIGINTGIEVTIKPNTLVENARIIVAGKLFTENCEKENTKIYQVRIEGSGDLTLDSISIDRLYIDEVRNVIINNCDIMPSVTSYDYAIGGWYWGSRLTFSNNIFRGNCDFSVSGTSFVFENNIIMSSFRFPSGTSNNISFHFNTIDLEKAKFITSSSSTSATPNIDFSNNYWGTTDTQLIDNFIIDRNDSLSINYYVNYLPILTEKPEMSKYTVSFDTNGGSVIQSITNLSKGAKINKPDNPTKQNYIFAGWYIDNNFTTEWNFENDTVENNLTLFAKWLSPLYPFEVTNVSGYKIGTTVVLSWTNPTDANFSHVRVILEGFEWAESMGATDQESGKTSYSANDFSGATFVTIKCVSKDGLISEGIRFNF